MEDVSKAQTLQLATKLPLFRDALFCCCFLLLLLHVGEFCAHLGMQVVFTFSRVRQILVHLLDYFVFVIGCPRACHARGTAMLYDVVHMILFPFDSIILAFNEESL